MIPRTETNRVFVHCTATPEGEEVSKDQLYEWHVLDNGWDDIGYHWIVHLDGKAEACRDETMQGAGVEGENDDSIHVVYSGGLDADGEPKDTRTQEQVDGIVAVLYDIQTRYPNLKSEFVYGHNQYAAKACPSYDVPMDVAAYLSEEPEQGNPEPGMGSGEPFGLAIAKMRTGMRRMEGRIETLESEVAVLQRRLKATNRRHERTT